MFSPASSAVREEMLQNILGLQTPETTGNTPSFDPDKLEGNDKAIFDELNDFEKYLTDYISSSFNPALLRFIDSQETSPSNPGSILSILSQTDPETRHTVYRLHGLQNLKLELESITCSNSSLVAQRDDLIAIADLEIKQMFSALWNERRLRTNNPLSMLGVRSIATENRSVNLHVSPLVMSALVLTAIIHTVMGVSRKNCNFVLACIRAIVSMALKMEMYRSEEFIRQHIADIPSTLPTTLHRLNLCPKFDLYACCPGCRKLYPCSVNRDQLLPAFCGAKDLDGKVCGNALGTTHRRGTRTQQKPTETYSHMRFETWISELVLREGVEDLLESARPNHVPGATVKDVWDAPMIKSFPNGSQPPFMDSPPHELRLTMMLHFDFFNPLENKEAGKKKSVGCFFMICLNLPPDQRYNPSNAYLVSVVPGPEEAKLDEINNFVKPIVDDMMEVYAPGIWLPRTHKYPHGRRVRAGVAIKSMDIPAARGSSGFAAHSHTCFCHLCNATRAQIASTSLDMFRPRTMATHRQLVQLWEDATSLKNREEIYKEHGVRGTDWLRFSWWNPFESVVVGPMHWTKNILDKQLRKNMGWDWDLPAGLPDEIPQAIPTISQLEYEWGTAAMLCLDEKGFKCAKLTAPLLLFLCLQRSIYAAGFSRNHMIEVLNDWRKMHSIISPNGERTLYAINRFGDDKRVSVLRAQYYVSKHPPASLATISQNALVADLRTICVEQQLDSAGQKEELMKRLQLHYKNVRIPNLMENVSPAAKQDKRKVSLLGFEVLEAVKQDMTRTLLPSWIKHPPINFATVNHGKLQSEEYKTLALVSFTITLVRLWGQNDSTAPLRERLDNFLHLMLAVRILAFQSLIESDPSAFDMHFKLYLEGLKHLYPSSTFIPVQHLGLHLPQFMRSLGPSTRWSESTCEQFIRMFQNITTNFKFGDLEQTLHREFVMAGRLKGLLDCESFTGLLGEFGEVVGDFMQQHLPSRVGYSWRVTHGSAPTLLEQPTYDALNAWASTRATRAFPRSLYLCSKIALGNVVYAPYTNSSGDSLVLFSPPATVALRSLPGRIEFILQERESTDAGDPRTVIIVRAFEPLATEETVHDPYFNNPIIGHQGADLARLCYNEFEDQTYLIEPRDLVSHIAVCLYADPEDVLSRSAVVTLSLDLKHERFA